MRRPSRSGAHVGRRPRRARWFVASGVVALAAAFLPLATLAGTSTASAPAIIDETGGWPSAPYDSQYGTVNIAYHCTLSAAGISTLSVDAQVALTALFPLTAAPGQPFYVTDGRGTAVIPAKFVNLLRSLGIRSVSGTSTRFDLTADGATPPVRNASPDGLPIPKTPLLKDQPLSITTPFDHELAIGPYSAQGGVVDIGIGTLRAELKPTLVGGIPMLNSVTLDCPSPSPKTLVALVPIGGKPDPTPIKIPGHIAAATVSVEGGLLGAVIPTPCVFSGYGTYTLGTNVNAFVKKLYAASHQKWQFLNGHGYVSVPKELVDAFLAKNPTVTGANVTLSELETVATDAIPARQNYLSGDVAGDPLVFQKDQASFGSFPAKSAMLPPETTEAGDPGVMRVYLGNMRGTLQLTDAAGTAVGAPVTYFCPEITHPQIPLLPYVITK